MTTPLKFTKNGCIDASIKLQKGFFSPLQRIGWLKLLTNQLQTDGWWLAVALINGLSTVPHGQPIHQGYHLVESIALAERPGTWHTQPEVGPHQLEWNPQAVVPRHSGVVVHDAGVQAARWLIEQLENSGSQRRLLLMEWIQLLLHRPNLVEPLGLEAVLLRRASDSDEEVAVRVTLCLAKAIEFNRDTGLELAKRLVGV